MAAPANLRSLVRRFAALKPGESARDFLLGLDWAGASTAELVHVLLERPPAGSAELDALEGLAPGEAAWALFSGPAFRQGLVARLLRAFGGKRRILFVHLPKCAGTDFEQVLRQRGPSLHPAFESAEACPPDALAASFRQLGKQLADAEDLSCGGHVSLRWYLDEGLFRFSDRLVTVVRDPGAIAVSFTNYILARFRDNPALDAIDTRGWAARLGLTRFDPAMGADALRALGLRIVTHPGLMPVNPLCALLGDGTAAGSFEQLRRAAIEIATVETYDAWLAARWGGARSARVNTQRQVIGVGDLAPDQRDRIEAAIQEDRVLMRAIRAAMGDRLWTTGPEVVAAARLASGGQGLCPCTPLGP